MFMANFTVSGEDGVVASVDAASESSYPLVLDAETINERGGARVAHPSRSASRASSMRMSTAETLRLRAAAAATTLLSGAVMMLAGYVGHAESWTTAGFITIPGGILILAAFALARRADGTDGHPVARTGSHLALRAGARVATLLSGAVMVLAGYAGSAWGWGLAAPLVVVGGLVVAVAFALDRRGMAPGRNARRKPL